MNYHRSLLLYFLTNSYFIPRSVSARASLARSGRTLRLYFISSSNVTLT
jgi:hypothetical protein